MLLKKKEFYNDDLHNQQCLMVNKHYILFNLDLDFTYLHKEENAKDLE